MPTVQTKSMAGAFGRVDLTPDEYARLIENKGYRARWEKATFCPHRSPMDYLQHDLNHTACDQGWLFYDPQEIKVLMTGLGRSQAFRETSRVESGQSVATTHWANRLSFFDKLTLLDSTMRFSELTRRNPFVLNDRTKYEVISVLDVRDTVRTYREGVDFQVVAGMMTWLDGGLRPDDNALYSLSYFHNPVYIVLDLSHDVRDTMRTPVGSFPTRQEEHARLPVQAMVKLHFMVRDQSLDTAPALLDHDPNVVEDVEDSTTGKTSA